jgi:hypothetical protein
MYVQLALIIFLAVSWLYELCLGKYRIWVIEQDVKGPWLIP